MSREGVVRVVEHPIAAVAELGRISIAFGVQSRFEIREGRGGRDFTLAERPVDPRYIKDYDATESGGPSQWRSRFDMSGWGLIVAARGDAWVGGAVVAARSPGTDMLEGLDDFALLWDIRAAPSFRGQGIGSSLMNASIGWARARGCAEVKVETQDINVPACRFYASSGFQLRAIDRPAYPGLDEVQMLWYRRIA